MSKRWSRRWRWPARALALGGSTVALWWVLRGLDLVALRASFRTLRWGWYLAAQGSFGLGMLGAGIRWHLMLRLNHEAVVHGGASVRMVFISQFFNTVLGGPSGGDLPKTALYAKWFGVPATHVLAASVLDRLAASIGGLVFATTALAIGATAGAFEFFERWEWRSSSGPRWPWVAGAVTAGLALALLAVLARRPGSFLARALGSLRQSLCRLLGSRRRSAQALGCAVVTSLLFNLTQLLCLQAVLPGDVPWLKLFWMYHLVTVVASLPVTFAGAGLREGAAMVLLRQYDIPATAAVAGALLTFSIQVTWALVGAWLLWWEQRRRRNTLPGRRAGRSEGGGGPSLSVVIPTWNEAEALPATVAHLRAIPEIREIVVADGGSNDGTAVLARELGCHVVSTERGRGHQLRAGAEATHGDVVWMVHADTWLPPEAGAALIRCLRDPLVVGGGFWKRFRQPPLVLRGARFRCWLRLWWNGRILGDQAVFVRRSALAAVGGIPEQPLMEDVELCRRLRRLGRLALAGAAVTTSERRFLKRGIWRTYRLMWQISRAYRRGVPPAELARRYDRD